MSVISHICCSTGSLKLLCFLLLFMYRPFQGLIPKPGNTPYYFAYKLHLIGSDAIVNVLAFGKCYPIIFLFLSSSTNHPVEESLRLYKWYEEWLTSQIFSSLHYVYTLYFTRLSYWNWYRLRYFSWIDRWRRRQPHGGESDSPRASERTFQQEIW